MDTKENREILASLLGRHCIYKEKSFIRLVKVIEADVSDWGVKYTFECIPAPGIEASATVEFSADGSWEALHISDESIGIAWVGSILVFRDDLVESILAFANQTDDRQQMMSFINNGVGLS
jgi:hypothetical protein